MTKHLKKRSLIIIAVTLIILLTAGAYVYFTYFTLNPLLESQLRSQFGDEFFDDFAEEPEPENDSELLDDIIEKYEPHFETLENRALERLEELFTAAVEEYNQQRKTGRVDRFQLTNKYIQAGQLLENRVNDSFYSLLTRMENELNRKGLPTDIISEIEAAYIEAKDKKKEELFERLRDTLKR